MELVIKLKGEKLDLEALSACPDLNGSPVTGADNTTRSLRVTAEHGVFYLRIVDSNLQINDDKLLSYAQCKLSALNGQQKVDNLNFRPVAVDGVTKIDQDAHQNQYIFPPPLVVRTRVNAVVGGDRSSHDSRQPTGKFPMDDPKIAQALRWFNRGDWGSLYNIHEIIKLDVGRKIYDDEWVKASQINAFKHTVNNLRALRDDARHAREDRDPPANPMSLPEAKKLMQALLKRWIRFKRSPGPIAP